MLLQKVSEDSCNKWHRKEEFQLVWHQEYIRVVNFYVTKVIDYTEKFMATPAGKQMKTDAAVARRSRKGLPLIDEETLKTYKDEDGLNWSIAHFADFFQILGEVAPTREFETLVLLIIFQAHNSLVMGIGRAAHGLHLMLTHLLRQGT